VYGWRTSLRRSAPTYGKR